MAKYKILKNPPITEALIDIRITPKKPVEISQLDNIYKRIQSTYPIKKMQRKTGTLTEISSQGAKTQVVEDNIAGFAFVSQDEHQVFQAQLNGFTFSRLKKYEQWENVRDEAKRLWDVYADIIAIESVTRVAVRYINNLRIPVTMKDFSEFLTAPPVIPDKLPQSLSAFLSRIVFPVPDLEAMTIITHSLDYGNIIPNTQSIPVILDIDVFKIVSDISSEEIWQLLEKLRDFKNDVFHGSITKRLLKEYE